MITKRIRSIFRRVTLGGKMRRLGLLLIWLRDTARVYPEPPVSACGHTCAMHTWPLSHSTSHNPLSSPPRRV